MTQPNPYQAPSAPLAEDPVRAGSLAELARGQKLVIYAILLNMMAIGMGERMGTAAVALLGLATPVLSILGLFAMASALRFSTGAKVLLAIAMLIPLVNLIVMLVLNAKATKALRAGGYTVGLLGATKPKSIGS